MKINSEVVTAANSAKAQSASLSVETKLMPPYLRFSVPAERAQIEAIIKQAKREFLLSAPALEANSQAIASQVHSLVSDPHSGKISPSIKSSRGPGAVPGISENLSPAQPATTNPPIVTGASNKKVTGSGSLVPDGVVSLGWYCPTEFRVNCATGQTRMLYFYYLYCGLEQFYLGKNNNGTLYFGLDGQTYGLGAKAQNGTLPVKVVCEVQGGGSQYTVELPVTLNFVNQPPCISLQSASFPDEQDPCELIGNNHGQRPKIRVNLTAPAGPSGQTVFLLMDDPHNPSVGRWVNAGIDSFVIPFGQTSGEWEGFLGTRKVLVEKTITIRARVNGQESQGLTIKVKRN